LEEVHNCSPIFLFAAFWAVEFVGVFGEEAFVAADAAFDDFVWLFHAG